MMKQSNHNDNNIVPALNIQTNKNWTFKFIFDQLPLQI